MRMGARAEPCVCCCAAGQWSYLPDFYESRDRAAYNEHRYGYAYGPYRHRDYHYDPYPYDLYYGDGPGPAYGRLDYWW